MKNCKKCIHKDVCMFRSPGEDEITCANFGDEEALEIEKAETVKEYKEKVKKNLLDRGFYPVLVKIALNEVEKEMVGKSE